MTGKKYTESVSIVPPICCGMAIHKNKISCCLVYEHEEEFCMESKPTRNLQNYPQHLVA